MHLTIMFRYKVTDNTNISGTTSKRFLSHVKTKNELTIYLAQKVVTNFVNVNGGYAVSYTTANQQSKVIVKRVRLKF